MAIGLPHSVFLHCPKTGGSWVRQVLIKNGIPTQMLGAHRASENLPAKWKTQFRFAFVRHPLTWYASYFAYRVKKGWTEHHMDKHCSASTFDDFLNRLLDWHPGYCGDVLMKRYFEGTDFVGRFENLREDLAIALTKAGESFEGEILRSHPPFHITDYRHVDVNYSPEMRQRILDSEHTLITRYYT